MHAVKIHADTTPMADNLPPKPTRLMTKEEARAFLIRMDRQERSRVREDGQAFLIKNVRKVEPQAQRDQLYNYDDSANTTIEQLFDHVDHLEAGCRGRTAWLFLRAGCVEFSYRIADWTNRFWDDQTVHIFLDYEDEEFACESFELIEPLTNCFLKHGCKVEDHYGCVAVTPPVNWYEFLTRLLGNEEKVAVAGLADEYDKICWSIHCNDCKCPIFDLVSFDSNHDPKPQEVLGTEVAETNNAVTN